MSSIELGIIGGSGLYGMTGLSDIEEIKVETPFGDPSDAIIVGTLHGRRVAFLPRHGRGHLLTPTEVPYRANIYALKSLGIRYIVAISACGSLREDFAPGHIVIPDQIVDFTKNRERSFFSSGLVSHLSPAHPFSAELGKALANALGDFTDSLHEGGVFMTIEGPRFSTQGEANLYRQWGMSIIGMTTSPEVFLAAEAEIAYAVMAHVTDYDVWHEDEKPVTVEMVIRVLQRNTQLAQLAITKLVKQMDEWAVNMAAHQGMKDALITDRSHISPQTRKDLELIVGRYLD